MRDIGIVQTQFVECSALGSIPGQGAAQAIQIFQSSGARFLAVTSQVVHESPDPLAHMDPEGSLIIPLDFEQPLLQRSRCEPEVFEHCQGIASFAFLQPSRTVDFGQGGPDEPEKLDGLANGQLSFACLLYPRLACAFGCVDEMGDNMASAKSVKKTELKHIYWANFFGPAYVKKFGNDFLLGAPGWKKEKLGDGGVLCVVTESYYDWWSKPPKNVLEYFQTQVPGIKLYRAKSSFN